MVAVARPVRSLSRALVAAVVAVGLLGAVPAGATPDTPPPSSGAPAAAPATAPEGEPVVTGRGCAPGVGVTVVVDFQGVGDHGGVAIGCAEGHQTSGFAALTNAEFVINEDPGALPNTICQIDGVPDAGFPSCWFSAYWAYWKAEGSQPWEYSRIGAAQQGVAVDSIEGWSWSDPIPSDGTGVPMRLTVRQVRSYVVRAWATAVYTDLLGRAPTPTEAQTVADRVMTGTAWATIARELTTSDEWLTTIVTSFYRSTLGRDPDPAGLAYWIGRLRSGGHTVAEVAAAMYASPEYFQGLGGGTPESWVTDLYDEILDRVPSGPDLAYWTGVVADRGRTPVARQIYQSLESRRDRVQGLYQALLGRTAEPAGRDYWAGRILAEGDLALAVELAVSSEYIRRANVRFG